MSDYELLVNENEQLRGEIKRVQGNLKMAVEGAREWSVVERKPSPCACRFVRRSDFSYPEQVEWCKLHAKQRDALTTLQKENERLQSENSRLRQGLDDALASHAKTIVDLFG